MFNIRSEMAAKKRNTFTSYLNSKNYFDVPENATVKDLKLLPGEIQVASTQAVLYPPTVKITDTNENEGTEGVLIVTNFKLSFISDQNEKVGESYQENIFLGRNDVCLNNIDLIYQIVDKKKRKLVPQQKISSRIEALHIICKNFRFLKFSFKSKEGGKNIAHTLALFAYPSRSDLSFGNLFKENYYNTTKMTVTMFNSKNDWSRELIRCGATEWRVLSAESYNSKILPKYFVIPKTLDMDKFEKYTRSFYDGRICFWTYSFGKASLLRIGEMKSIEDSYIYNTAMEKIRLNDPEKQPLALFNLCDLLPSIQDVQRGYTRLRELCTPENPRQVLLQESKYLQLLEKSSWLLYVSLALKESNRAAQLMLKGKTVVLQENTGRDLCCVISSLTQIILDPYFRSIDGFQSLIQKEWVALEHPFSDRLGHLYNPDGQDKESPILLLFLDCVWQLLQQFPAEFEYSETYLTTIWDSAFIPIFDTFQFNSDFDRQVAVKEQKLTLRSVWDWSEQFSERDKMLFTNPFFTKKENTVVRKSLAIPPNAIPLHGLQKSFSSSRLLRDHSLHTDSIPKDKFLSPKWEISSLSVWQQCYHRWIPLFEIKNGGFPHIDLFNRLLLSNINKLQKKLESGYDFYGEDEDDDEDTINVIGERIERRHKLSSPNNEINFENVNSFFPFSSNENNSDQLNEILISSNDVLMDGSIMERND